MLGNAIATVVAVLVAALMLSAGPSKIAQPHGLSESLVVLGLVPRAVAPSFVRTIAAVEISAAVGAAAANRIGQILGLVIGTSIVAFTLYGWRQRADLRCGCFGGNSSASLGWGNLGAGAFLIAGYALLLASDDNGRSMSHALTILLASSAGALGTTLGLWSGRVIPILRHGLSWSS